LAYFSGNSSISTAALSSDPENSSDLSISIKRSSKEFNAAFSGAIPENRCGHGSFARRLIKIVSSACAFFLLASDVDAHTTSRSPRACDC
jgi:hypothetical protein